MLNDDQHLVAIKIRSRGFAYTRADDHATTMDSVGGSRYLSWVGAEVAQGLDRAVSPRRAEHCPARPGARTAEVEMVDWRAVVAEARNRTISEHLVRQNLTVEDVAPGDAN